MQTFGLSTHLLQEDSKSTVRTMARKQSRRLHRVRVWRGLCSPHFDKRLGTGGAGVENSIQETDQTVPIIMEVFTSTTNCTFTVKVVEGQDPNFFSRHFASDQYAPLSNSFQCHCMGAHHLCNTVIWSRLDTTKPACQTDDQLRWQPVISIALLVGGLYCTSFFSIEWTTLKTNGNAKLCRRFKG